MTGPLWGTLPDRWLAGQVKNAATVTLGKMLQSRDSGSDARSPYMRAANVQPDGVLALDDVNEMWFSDAEREQLSIRVGDVVVVEGGQGGFGRAAYIGEDLPGWGFQNSISRLRPFGGFDGRFIAFYLIALRAGGFIRAYSNVVSMPHLTAEKLARIPMPLPPLEEQHAIADYLDRETARIATLIEEQQRLVEILRERRDSAWGACVETARRLGRPVAVRRVIESIVDGPFGSSLTSAHYSDEGVRVIRLGNIGVNEFKVGDAAFIPLDYAEELEAHAVEQGDVVVAGLGDDKMPLGRAAVVPALGPAIVKADCYRLRPNEQVSPAYLAWVMSAPQTRSQIMLLARGSTRARLNTTVVQQVEIPVPERHTQDALVAKSDAETAKIDTLIAETERFIELARERRSALITAAVTGQIDVREMA